MINVLWIDDDHEDFDDLKKTAKSLGFQLNGYKSREEGFRELEANISYYDLILLDGLFFDEHDQESGTANTSALVRSIANWDQLRLAHGFETAPRGVYRIFSSYRAVEFDCNPTSQMCFCAVLDYQFR